MIFGDVVDLLGELFATLLSERRNRNAYELAVVRRIQAEIGGANCLLNCADLRLIPGLHGEHLRLRRMDRSHLAQRRHRAVVVNHHSVEETYRSTTRAHSRQLAPEVVDDGFHSWFSFFDNVLFTHVANSAK